MENTLSTSTFTFIANYKGGIYIRQVTAKNLVSACHIWAEQIVSKEDIPTLNGAVFLQSFRDDIELLAPVPLQNTSNVWAFSVSNRRTFMLVNIIKTVESEAGVAPAPAASGF